MKRIGRNIPQADQVSLNCPGEEEEDCLQGERNISIVSLAGGALDHSVPSVLQGITDNNSPVCCEWCVFRENNLLFPWFLCCSVKCHSVTVDFQLKNKVFHHQLFILQATKWTHPCSIDLLSHIPFIGVGEQMGPLPLSMQYRFARAHPIHWCRGTYIWSHCPPFCLRFIFYNLFCSYHQKTGNNISVNHILRISLGACPQTSSGGILHGQCWDSSNVKYFWCPLSRYLDPPYHQQHMDFFILLASESANSILYNWIE